MTSEKADRRRYSTMTKAHVVAQCAESGSSVAKIAMANGINANIVHRWRKLARDGDAKVATRTGEFIA
ncbi:Transposase [compost metagenome]|jgi:transposase